MFSKAINPKREVFDPDVLKLYYPYLIFKDDIIFLTTFVKMSDYKLWFKYFKDDESHLLEININDDFKIYPLKSIYEPRIVSKILSMMVNYSSDLGMFANLIDKEKDE